ncbi:MAG: TIGR00282 family metallophosphoesterase [Chloroflexi bacterium]|nr:TIGR00282 family metallophosphoesterase [Chloroflexota bacterium]
MNILFFGDITGKNGRLAIKEILPSLRQEYMADIVIANGENAAGGIGLTPETADELLSYGIDVITGGNHIFAHKEMQEALSTDINIPVVRLLNYPKCVIGQGFWVNNKAAVVSLMGRVFINGALDCPFHTMDTFLNEHKELPKIIIVDLHAEATSEKRALSYYLDGRVSAVLGTHTHVTTADEQILPKGTAYITDVGMVGPAYSVLGNEPKDVIERFTNGIQNRLPVARDRCQIVSGVWVQIDDKSGAALKIERVRREVIV